MSFFTRLQMALNRWLQGRNGMDELGLSCMVGAIVCSVLALFGIPLMSLLPMVCYVYAVFRMMSRNIAKRHDENRRYCEAVNKCKTEIRQFMLRMKGMKTYKYFRCPHCRTRLRLKRGCGQKHITCPKCHQEFDERA